MFSRTSLTLVFGVVIVGGWAAEAAEHLDVTTLIERGDGFGGAAAVAVDPHHPGVVLAGDRRGRIWRSDDSGSSWKSLIPEPEVLGDRLGVDAHAVCNDMLCATSSIVYDPLTVGTVYLAKVGTFFRSEDSGRAWEHVGPEMARGSHRSALVVHPGEAGTVFVGTDKGVFRSQDRGDDWERVLQMPTRSLAMSTSDPAVIYAAGPSLQRSDDGGHTWEERTDGLFTKNVMWIGAVAVDPRDHDLVYAGAFSAPRSDAPSVFRSEDGGGTWHALDIHGHEIHVLLINPSNPDVLYAGGGSKGHPDGLFRSADGGQTWTVLEGHGSTMSLDLNRTDPDEVYEGTNWGLYRYSGSQQAASAGQGSSGE